MTSRRSKAAIPPVMVVGGKYELLRTKNGFPPGTKFECYGADTKDPVGEFRLWRDTPRSVPDERLRSATWFFAWEDMSNVP